MRLVLVFALVGSLAYAEALPDVVFDTARGNLSTVTLVDGRVLSGVISSFDAEHVALIDPTTQQVTGLARADIASVRLGDAPLVVRPLAPQLVVHRAPRLSVLTKVGLGVLGASYGLAVAGGVAFMSWNYQEGSWHDDAYGPELYKQGYELLVPVVGPFLSAAAGAGYPSWWEGVWIADGVAQIAGVSILIAGLVRQQQHAAPLSFRGATFTPLVTPTSIGLSGTF